MRPLALLFCLISVYTAFAQSFDESITAGEALYDSKDYTASAKFYSAAFAIKEGNASQYYNAACSWALTGDTIQSLSYAKLAAEKGYKNWKHCKTDKDLAVLHTTKGWAEVLDLVKTNQDAYEKDFDQTLKSTLEYIYLRDQTLRQLYKEAEEKFGAESDEMQFFWQTIHEQDSLNEVAVEHIIEEKGWVGKSLVGGKANMTLWLVIQHAPLEKQEKYLPLLKASVAAGESSGNHLALLEDRVLMYKGLPQIYGSQIITDETTGRQKVYELEAPEYVNQRRAAVGLGPIEAYVKRWNIEWTVPQKLE